MPTLHDIEEGKPILDRVRELQGFWQARDLQWAEDRALLALKYKARIRPFELIIGNEPAVMHQGAVAILGGKEPIYRIPITVQELDQRTKMNKSERFITAIMREVDSRWRKRGHGPWLLDMLYYATLGAVAMFPRIIKHAGKPPEFHCDLYDPMSIYPSFGDRGLVRVARVYATSYDDARSMAQANGWNAEAIERPAEDYGIDIVSYWELGDAQKGEDAEAPYNVVLANQVIIKPKTREPQFGTIPLVIIPMGGVPWRAFTNPLLPITDANVTNPHAEWISNWGRPMFWMNRELYRALDRLMSYEAERTRRAAYSKYVALTADGQIHLTEEEFQKAEIVTLNASEGESLRGLEVPSEAREAGSLRNEIFSMMQRGGLNRLALGDLNLEISGVTLERAAAAARFILEPYAEGSARALADIGGLFFEQMKRLRVKKVTLALRQASLGAEAGFMVEEFGREDIPDTTYMEVDLPMLLPDDRMRKATIARTLIPGNDPLLDRQSTAEDVLSVPDWEVVKRRMDEDAVERSPAIQAVKMLAALRRLIAEWAKVPDMAGAVEEAQIALTVMREQFRALAAPREQPTAGLQPKSAAPAPSEQPSEERGASSSDMEMVTGQASRIANPDRARMLADILAQRNGQQ